VDRNGEALLAAIQRGLETPESELPEIPHARKPEPEEAGLVDLLQAVLRARAQEEEIAPGLLATTSDLEALVETQPDQELPDLPILRGWRRTLAGDTLLSVLTGHTVVSVDSRTRKLRLTPKA
jgi:ribonuclease D